DYAAPVITYNSGYNLSTRGSRSEITRLTNGNQLSLEYRFFSPSRPDPADWTKLDIAQAAADQHRITQALKARIYHDNKWLTIGVYSYGDEDLTSFLPYYHQCATQLGYPTDDESYLVGLLHRGEDTAAAYIPAGQGIAVPPYDNGAAMHDVQDWISTSGSQLL